MPRPHLVATPRPLFGSRRAFLAHAGHELGLLALGQLMAAEPGRDLNPLAARPGHFPAKAKSVIWLFLNGGPSQVDTWDYKPALAKYDGQEMKGFDKATGFFVNEVGPLKPSPFAFRRHGKSGTWASEIFPHLSACVDDMAFVHSLYTETNNHSPALFQINTGMSRMGFPCVGAWVTYGLGSACQNLPAFVTMVDTLGRGLPKGHAQNWGAGFLPGAYQGTGLNAQGAPIDNMQPLPGSSDAAQRRQLDLIRELNQGHQQRSPHEAALAARIESFELAYRMQSAAPEAFDIDREPLAIREAYGTDRKECGHFAKQALVARRLVERGVRFVQIYSGGMENERSWDGHKDLAGNHRQFATETDRPTAALLNDLKRRGLLDSTLVICCGEFGRLPIVQLAKGSDAWGRDHNPHAFTCWFAGGGIKPGVHHGATDELGFKAVENRASVNDLHATILHLLGLDHTKLTYRYSGREFRLTDVAGNVIREIVA